MAQIRHAVRTDKESGPRTSWVALVSTPGNRKRMMIVVALAVFSQWRYVCYPWNPSPKRGYTHHREGLTLSMLVLCSGNGLVSYYIRLILEGVGVKDPTTQGAINGGLQVWKPPHVFHAFHSIRTACVHGYLLFSSSICSQQWSAPL